MKLRLFNFVVAFATLAFSGAVAQNTPKITSDGTAYLEYLPQGYNTNTNKYPLVISLHGIKERGTTSTDPTIQKTDVLRVANVGLPKYTKFGAQYSFILISPQLKSSYGSWPADYIMDVVNYARAHYRVDPTRIYITGLSLGGGGVWKTVAAYPSVFAAAIPICPASNALNSACTIASNDVAIWDFHGDKDGVVNYSVSTKMVNAMNACADKPNPLAKMTIFPGMGHVIWDKVYKETNALDWMLSFRNGSAPPDESTSTNKAPIANAGSDKTLLLPSNSTTLLGSGSDPDGTVTAYSWTKKEGGSVTLTGVTTKELKASNMVEGTYRFGLTVKDDKGAASTDDVIVTVKKDGTVTTNYVPVAKAGSDKLLVLPANSASLIGSATDADGTIASYSWSKVSGGSAVLSGLTSATLKLSGLVSGTYTFRLTVKDNKGAIDTDDVVVIVDAKPVVNAGSDRTISLPYGSLSLTATASDPDGTIASYLWSKYSGPNLTVTNKTTKTVTLSGFYAGTYVMKVAVKDNHGAVTFDYVKIVVTSSTASIEKIADPTSALAFIDQTEESVGSLIVSGSNGTEQVSEKGYDFNLVASIRKNKIS